MDTLGTIDKPISWACDTARRTEALERLRYLALTGACGHLTGASGTGKSWLFSQLAGQLRRNGISVAQLNLTGVTGAEIPLLLASRLGLGMSSRSDPLAVWTCLHEYAQGSRQSNRRMAILVDHADRADGTAIAPLGRLLEAFSGTCAWLFATQPLQASDPLLRLLQQRAWLRIELQPLRQDESAQVLADSLAREEAALPVTDTAVESAQALTQGQFRRLRLLAELTARAVETEDISEINGDLIRSVAEEMAF